MKIGLVLAGGMAKGAYQIGVLRALQEVIPPEEIEYMSCASIGVLNGYAFATGNLDRAEKMWRTICSGDTRLLVTHVLRSSLLQQNIVNLHDPETPIKPKFYASLYDMTCRNIVYKELSKLPQEKLPLYLKASVAMPIYNRAVAIGAASYFDGAMVDNIPVYPLMQHGLDYVICVYFDDTSYEFESKAFDKRVIKITFPNSSVLRQSLLMEKNSIEAMIKDGYERTKHLLQYYFCKGYDNLDYIYSAISYEDRKRPKKLRLTGDVVVTKLNQLTQKFSKRKIQ